MPQASSGITAVEQVSGTDALLIGISAVNDNVVWAAGVRGTWVRTTDGGATWQRGSVPGAEHLQFRDVHAVDARTAFLLAAGSADSSRIYFTNDAGATWTLQFTNSEPAGFYDCMAFWDARRGIVIGDAVNDETRLLITDDGGANWRRVPPNVAPSALPVEGAFAASGTCAVTRPGGKAWIAMGTPLARLFHTSDYGANWSVDTIPLTTIGSVSFRDDIHGMVFGGEGGPGSAVTHDGGRTWTPATAPALERGLFGGVFVPGARSPIVVVTSPGGLAWSRDDGRTWVVINRNNYWSLAFASPNAGWAVGAGGRITKLSGF